MRIKMTFRLFVAALTCLCLPVVASAQIGGPAVGNGGLAQQNAYNNQTFGASFDPAGIDYDLQFFAPVDESGYNDSHRGLSNYYAAWERNWKSVDRPGRQGTVGLNQFPTGSDFMTGNNFKIGYTNDQGNGWSIDFDRLSGSFFSSGTNDLIAQPMMTTTTISDVSFNRMFRQNLSRGGYIEPYVGLRYMNFGDETIHDGESFFLNINNPATPLDDNIEAGFDRFTQKVTNNAIGGHAGFRYTDRRGRFGVRTSAGIAGFYNQQSYSTSNSQNFPNPAAIFSDGNDFRTLNTSRNSQSFMPMLNLDVLATFAITRNVALRVGGGFNYIWDGLNRANTLGSGFNPNSALTRGPRNPGALGPTQFFAPGGIENQDAVVAGFSIGLEWSK